MGALVAVSLAAALLAITIPPEYVGLIGFAPIAIGLNWLWDARSGQAKLATKSLVAGVRGNMLAVAAVTMADGGDNVGAYTPLFATETSVERSITAAVFAILTLAWCAVAIWLVRHSAFGAPFQRYRQRALPFILIGLGALFSIERDQSM